MAFANRGFFGLIILFLINSCSLWERKQYEYAYQKTNENEVLVDFTKINPGSWDTLMFVAPYAGSEQIGLSYSDSEYLAFHSGADFYVVAGFLEDGNLEGYTLASREQDFTFFFEDSDSVSVKKIPRTEAIFRFIKDEDGAYKLKK
jgi:hypothetical protein